MTKSEHIAERAQAKTMASLGRAPCLNELKTDYVIDAHVRRGQKMRWTAPEGQRAAWIRYKALWRAQFGGAVYRKLKNYRRLASRFEKLDTSHLGLLHFASALIGLRSNINTA